jgi:hypothetical protein
VKVTSSQIERVAWVNTERSNALGWNEDENDEYCWLIVEFKGGARYIYRGVPELTKSSLVAAPSVGRFFAANVKDLYPAYKLEAEACGPHACCDGCCGGPCTAHPHWHLTT